jgi:hypothetical protein
MFGQVGQVRRLVATLLGSTAKAGHGDHGKVKLDRQVLEPCEHLVGIAEHRCGIQVGGQELDVVDEQQVELSSPLELEAVVDELV